MKNLIPQKFILILLVFTTTNTLNRLGRGGVVDLIREPDNIHDRDAIRVEIGGETVGYVANSTRTLIECVKSASDIKNTRSTQAEVQFILFNEWVIAKLI